MYSTNYAIDIETSVHRVFCISSTKYVKGEKEMSLTNTNKHEGDLWRTPEVIRNMVLSLLDPCVGRGDNRGDN